MTTLTILTTDHRLHGNVHHILDITASLSARIVHIGEHQFNAMYLK
jgi:hypothetical protein